MARDIRPVSTTYIPDLPPGVTEITVRRRQQEIVLHTLRDWREVIDHLNGKMNERSV